MDKQQKTRKNKEAMKIATWNCNGKRGRKDELSIFLQEEEVEIMLLQETRLRQRDALRMTSYQTFRKDRTEGGPITSPVTPSPRKTWKSQRKRPAMEFESDRHRRERPGRVNANDLLWNSNLTNPNGATLRKWQRSKANLVIKGAEDHTTCPNQANHRSDVLDIFMLKNVTTSSPVTRQCLDSGHFPVVMNVYTDKTLQHHRQ
ncbi:hypothetical protein QE152_g29073 [Popillia japonica]|uniref:Endonuclease/exonuclease/phosphatase domain-containing protein n=1 Tax=Popillia japonica TaxID=7064 RepID=A0AAW1JIM4_POPJA